MSTRETEFTPGYFSRTCIENEKGCNVVGVNTRRRNRSCQDMSSFQTKNSIRTCRTLPSINDPYSSPTNHINRYVIYRHLHGSKFKITNSIFEPKKRRFNGLFSFKKKARCGVLKRAVQAPAFFTPLMVALKIY